MTEGWAEIGDGKIGLRIDVDRATAPLLGLLTHRVSGGKFFCQIQLSALELDDTRKPAAYRPGPRRFRFSVSATLTKKRRTTPPGVVRLPFPPKKVPTPRGWMPPSD